jgi:Putative prokaryotic signal transducing protein
MKDGINNELVWIAHGMLDAEMIRALLESFNIQAQLFQESAGVVYGINFGPLGEVKIYVSKLQAVQAKEVLDDYQEGKLEAKPN